MTKTHNILSVMRGTMYLAFFVVSFLQLNAQINTQQVMNIGRNALYFEDYLLSIQYFNQLRPSMLIHPYIY